MALRSGGFDVRGSIGVGPESVGLDQLSDSGDREVLQADPDHDFRGSLLPNPVSGSQILLRFSDWRWSGALYVQR